MYLAAIAVACLIIGAGQFATVGTWDGGTGDFTDMNWDGGMAHPGTLSGSNILRDGEIVDIF